MENHVFIMKLLFVVNDFEAFMSHRLAIGLRALEKGYDVYVAAPGEPPKELMDQGLKSVSIPMTRRGANLLVELNSMWALFRLFMRLQPDLLHLVTIKPVLYGGIMARVARVPGVVTAIPGLGTLFTTTQGVARLMQWIALIMYRVALGHPNQNVIFQNLDDRAILARKSGLDKDKTVIIRGSGVDLDEFSCYSEPAGLPVVVMAARLLREKGVEEFIDAARILVARGIQARFLIVGIPDPGNPSSVSVEQIEQWKKEGVVEFAGFRGDVSRIFRESHIVVLPSYREGLPKVLLEAAACCRAVVTTDVPGCRDAIENGVSGVLVPVHNAMAIANALQELILDQEKRQSMGKAGRVLAEREFDISRVVDVHMDIYDRLLCR